jgi:hypothetical protein
MIGNADLPMLALWLDVQFNEGVAGDVFYGVGG